MTGPVGGAVAGYSYAKNQQKIREFNPEASNTWTNPFVTAIIAAMIFPIGGAAFGWGCGKQELKLERYQQEEREYNSRPSGTHYNTAGFSADLSQQKWQERLQQQEALGSERSRS